MSREDYLKGAEVGAAYHLYDHWNDKPLSRKFRVVSLTHSSDPKGRMTLAEILSERDGDPFSFPISDFRNRFIPLMGNLDTALVKFIVFSAMLKASNSFSGHLQDKLVELEV